MVSLSSHSSHCDHQQCYICKRIKRASVAWMSLWKSMLFAKYVQFCNERHVFIIRLHVFLHFLRFPCLTCESFQTRSSGPLIICYWLSVVSLKDISHNCFYVTLCDSRRYLTRFDATDFKLYCRPGFCYCWPSLPALCHFMLNWFYIECLTTQPGAHNLLIDPGLQSVHCPDPLPCVQHYHCNRAAVWKAFKIQPLSTLFFSCVPLKICPHRV